MSNILVKLRLRAPKESPVGTYRVAIMSLPEECDWQEYLPPEIQYIFKHFPQYKERIRQILAQGKAIGVRTVLRTPENILKAVHTISVHSQKNYIITWLPKLLRDKHYPVVTDDDRARAKGHNEDLDQAIETIVRDRLRFKRLVLIDEENIGINSEEQRLMTELSELIYPLQVDYAVFRVIADNAHERTEVAQSIIKALLVVGPIAHVLEKFAAGVGKIFAASADDILGESAELMALRGSGFSWRELAKRSRILIPVFAVATYGAYSVHHLLESGHLIQGGIVFGFSAVALSLTTAVQSLFMYRKNLVQLIADKKLLPPESSWATTKLALLQDFTNPARLGLFIGAAGAPVMGILGSVLGLMDNGWVLAAIGSTESIVAGLTVLFAGTINERRFQRKLQAFKPPQH
ncbi:MAG: hypothetical protein A2754_01935 [Candidatus Magasanikbacteria bacterium RIFCSPHIGHO2_01_FULL_47_8]|uniref:Uncharacterized protein n=1 Tax=Candidatus Magasanikbacteria bacterium RIFCSPHIGHO2_01_FULL_47_8 TaxID=1798673 RepID=A0A1F6MAN6_9BACT|nr:MAG: hypothetical protein A2754_01935 [Candidatus Magasanikbacteria bacterium RIFCSPHIGHO2_01_FULL_47_8]